MFFRNVLFESYILFYFDKHESFDWRRTNVATPLKDIFNCNLAISYDVALHYIEFILWNKKLKQEVQMLVLTYPLSAGIVWGNTAEGHICNFFVLLSGKFTAICACVYTYNLLEILSFRLEVTTKHLLQSEMEKNIIK